MLYRRYFRVSMAGLAVLCCSIFLWSTSFGNYVSWRVEHAKGYQEYRDKQLAFQYDTSNASSRRIYDIEARLSQRKHRMKEGCARNGYQQILPGDEAYRKNKYLSKSLFYTDKWKILMCLIPKCATRSQATFLGTSEGFGRDAVSNAYAIAEKYLSPRSLKRIEDVAMRINGYTKVIVAREPFSRLLSAYRDKIEGGGRGNHYKVVHDRIRKWNSNPKSSVSFSDFVHYLVNSTGDPQVDPHWNYYTRLCSPCEMDYDYIVHLDSFEEDMKYIATKIGVQNYTLPPSFNAFTDLQKVNRYYKDVPPTFVNDLYHKYKLDYEILGFAPPPQF